MPTRQFKAPSGFFRRVEQALIEGGKESVRLNRMRVSEAAMSSGDVKRIARNFVNRCRKAKMTSDDIIQAAKEPIKDDK